ncbi:ribonucleotide reductase [Mycena haematopus]|nr:ribonucleotide reductase [Mycena haematopus]
MLYKDAANSKSNQKNLGTIKSSNLCTEIIEYSAPDETAVCNLASISLPSCISNGKYDFQLLTAPMPTALKSQILGNNKCFELYTSNFYTRRVLSGEFQVVCPWLLRELVDRGLWDENMKNVLIAHRGSVQNIPTILDNVKAIYKKVWEISQKR